MVHVVDEKVGRPVLEQALAQAELESELALEL